MKYFTPFLLVLCSFGIVLSAQADPIIKPGFKKPIDKRFTPTLRLKPNLTVDSINFGGEFCNMSPCAKELRNLRVNKATCPISVRILNNGALNAGRFVVRLSYTRWDGVLVSKTQLVNGLAAGGFVKSKLLSFNGIGYYRIDKPFRVQVDALNQVAESNESDNIKSRVFNQ